MNVRKNPLLKTLFDAAYKTNLTDKELKKVSDAIVQIKQKNSAEQITLDTLDENGNTALIVCIQKRNTALAEMLIDEGADINLEPNNKCSALTCAIVYFRNDIVRKLINKGVSIELVSDGFTPLNRALYSQNKEAALELLNAIEARIREENIRKLLQIPVSAENNIYYHNKTPLYLAASRGYTKVFNKLIELEPSLLTGDCTELFEAAVMRDCIPIVDILMDKNININLHRNYPNLIKKGYPLLYWAIQYSYTTIATRLIEAGADLVFSGGETALDCAVDKKNLPLIKLLFEKNVKLNKPQELKEMLFNCDQRQADVLFCLQKLLDRETHIRKDISNNEYRLSPLDYHKLIIYVTKLQTLTEIYLKNTPANVESQLEEKKLEPITLRQIVRRFKILEIDNVIEDAKNQLNNVKSNRVSIQRLKELPNSSWWEHDPTNLLAKSLLDAIMTKQLNKKEVESFKHHKYAVDEVIEDEENADRKKQYLSEALAPKTLLHSLFSKRRNFFPTSSNRGVLGQLKIESLKSYNHTCQSTEVYRILHRIPNPAEKKATILEALTPGTPLNIFLSTSFPYTYTYDKKAEFKNLQKELDKLHLVETVDESNDVRATVPKCS